MVHFKKPETIFSLTTKGRDTEYQNCVFIKHYTFLKDDNKQTISWGNPHMWFNTDSQAPCCQWRNPRHHNRIRYRSGPGYGPYSLVCLPAMKGCKILLCHLYLMFNQIHHCQFWSNSNSWFYLMVPWNVEVYSFIIQSYLHIFSPTPLKEPRACRSLSSLPHQICSVGLLCRLSKS